MFQSIYFPTFVSIASEISIWRLTKFKFKIHRIFFPVIDFRTLIFSSMLTVNLQWLTAYSVKC